MRKALALVIGLAIPALSAFSAEPWKAVFAINDGMRMAYNAATKALAFNPDRASQYRYEFSVPEEGNSATIRVHAVPANSGTSESHDAIVLSRGPDALVLCVTNADPKLGDRFEIYTLYQNLGIGFLQTTSVSPANATLLLIPKPGTKDPVASVTTFPLTRIE